MYNRNQKVYPKSNAVKFTTSGFQTGTPTTLGGTNNPLWRTTDGRSSRLVTLNITNNDSAERIIKIRDGANDDVIFTRQFPTGGSTITDVDIGEFVGDAEVSITTVTSSVTIAVDVEERDF